MRTARGSGRLSCHAFTMHAPLHHAPSLPCMPPFTSHGPLCHAPPFATHAPPLCHAPPLPHTSPLCHTCPLPFAMHAPSLLPYMPPSPCMPPFDHAHPPSPCMLPPSPCPLHHTHPPHGQTDTCENITFAKLHLRAVIKIGFYYQPQTKLREGNVFTGDCLSREVGYHW